MAPGASRPRGQTKGVGATTTNPRWRIWRNSGRSYFASINGGARPTKMFNGPNRNWRDGESRLGNKCLLTNSRQTLARPLPFYLRFLALLRWKIAQFREDFRAAIFDARSYRRKQRELLQKSRRTQREGGTNSEGQVTHCRRTFFWICHAGSRRSAPLPRPMSGRAM